MNELDRIGQNAREAAFILATATTELKNRALQKISEALRDEAAFIIGENEKDLEEGERQNITPALMDRLMLNQARINEMADATLEVIALPDPVGEIISGWKRPNGLTITKVRVPLGVIAIIYEARPNVTVDAAALCLKTGNALILRGSGVAINSNLALTRVISEGCEAAGLPGNSVQSLADTSHETARGLMRLNKFVDVLIPRGGEKLIKSVVENASVPVIETGVGNCHVYVDKDGDQVKAERIIINAKCQRPGVCNAAETLLVHEEIADEFIPVIAAELMKNGVELFGCVRTRALIKEISEANEDDWYREYLDLKMAVKIVKDVKEAITHINKYGSKHSEAIITENYSTARLFTDSVDSSSLYVNASTRFTDGGQFGMGAEIGISTQKLHARGPMALPELTSVKYIVYGDGQIRS